MTALPQESLYALLPAIYRTRDLASGESLRALLGIIEEELTRIQNDISGLYDNLFIETCADWVIPYLGDLVGLRFLSTRSRRAFAANTVAYRRRKGTLQTLTGLARDTTGWTACTVEYMPLLTTSQHMNCTRPDNLVIPNLHRFDTLESSGTPFELTTRTVDVRAAGRYHRDQVGLFVWRRGVYELQRVRAVPATGHPGAYFMNPLGCNVALHNPVSSRTGLTMATQPATAPEPLKRTVLARALEARRQALVDGLSPTDTYFDAPPVFSVYLGSASGALQQIPAEQIVVASLDGWWFPPAQQTYTRKSDGKTVAMPIKVAIDPQLGRLVFAAGQAPTPVFTNYSYGFAGPLGGGPYQRTLPATAEGTRVLSVSGGDVGGILQSLGNPSQAGSPWEGAGGRLCIEFADSDTYQVGALHIPAGGQLELRAQSWQRPLLQPLGAPVDARWHITLGAQASLFFNGLLIAGAVTLDGESGESESGGASPGTAVTLTHTTLVPGVRLLPSGRPAAPDTASVRLGSGLRGLNLTLDSSISGAIDLSLPADSSGLACLYANDSIIDGTGSSQPALQSAQATLARVTVLGSTHVQAIEQTVDTLFCGPVFAPAGTPSGIRYCYLPAGSQVPAPYRCQPAMGLSVPGINLPLVTLQLVPWLISRRYGTPGYGQLDPRCHPALRSGASIPGEFGAMQSLEQAEREASILECQAEYLRFGLTLNLFPVT